MIDTDKYEGHDNWEGTKVNMANRANVLLIADAPKLLAEVKRLRSIAEDLYVYIISDAGISLKIIEEQMDWEDSPTNNWGDEE